jgi:hypothetical protein
MKMRRKERQTMEPTLLIALGPPPDGWERNLFDEFQESRREGDWSGTFRWEQFERELIERVLFGREGVGRSGMVEVLFHILGMDCHVPGHDVGYGVNRGFWVVNISMPISGVRRKDGSPLVWPPVKKERDVLGATLGLMFRREWVFMAALTPA